MSQSDNELSLDDIEALVSNKVPHTVSKQGWIVDPLELGRACKAYKLEHPVRVRFTSGRRTWGTHRTKHDSNSPTGYTHWITLSQVWTREKANHTLWHEFFHCMQAEDFARKEGRRPTAFYHEAYSQTGYAYVDNPYEIACEKFAERQAPKWSLLS